MTSSIASWRGRCTSVIGCRLQSGFSLIELMVAMIISMLIMGAILTLFLDLTRTNDEMAKTNAQIESGRFAVQLIQSDLAHAGFWNGYIPQFDDLAEDGVPSDVPTAVPDPCAAYASWGAAYITNLLGIPIQAYEHDGVPGNCSGVVANLQANTDVLVVRHAGTCTPGVGNCEADTAGKLYFQASFCEDDVGAYVLGTNGFTLHPRTTVPAGLASCADAASTLFAPKRKFISSIYYIRDYSVTPGDGIPTLMRSQFDLDTVSGELKHLPAQALIEGIEGFRVELGVDSLSKTGAAVDYGAAVNWADPADHTIPTNRGNGSPDGSFVRCTTASPCTANTLTNVVAVKLHLLVRNLTATTGYTDSKTYNLGATTLGPFNDGFKRHVFSTAVRLVNISGRRETP
ncbi:PilW family protein [Pseudomonas zhanjiangensis]|uniref:PilW family protein n=1 Tax=Pseudomonas zhanjiangensis TaxID=3239015 RepID=A0ABV3YQQ7_9PSED